jgi:hypothetical protein
MNLHQQLARNRLSAALELERNPSADQSKWLAQIAELETIAKGEYDHERINSDVKQPANPGG